MPFDLADNGEAMNRMIIVPGNNGPRINNLLRLSSSFSCFSISAESPVSFFITPPPMALVCPSRRKIIQAGQRKIEGRPVL